MAGSTLFFYSQAHCNYDDKEHVFQQEDMAISIRCTL